MIRCVIYARYSSNMQFDRSIEDQIRRCEEFASRQGWIVVKVYADRAISGASVAGRDELRAMEEASRGKPLPFERVLIDDTSRLGRNLPEVLGIVAKLKYRGVYLTSVTQQIDSAQEQSRSLLTITGMMDEEYSKQLGSKVHRGQEGHVLKGYHPGGKCYGYRNVPIEDPTKLGKYNRAVVDHVRLEIVETEAAVVRRIFELYGSGQGLRQITKQLNAEGVPSPQRSQKKPVPGWHYSSIRSMLQNERYRGVVVWNRTQKRMNPEVGRSTSKPRPQSEWRTVSVPDLRLVSEELWEAAEARFRDKKRTGITRCGGFARSERSRRYLFSGLLRCGCCNSQMVIVSGQGKRGYSKYGCPSHRNRGVCGNRLTIRQDRLEAQLLDGLQRKVWNQATAEHAVRAFQTELKKRLSEVRSRTDATLIRQEQTQLRLEAGRLADAIAKLGGSPTLIERMQATELRISALSEQIERATSAVREPSYENIRAFVLKMLSRFPELVGRDPERARDAFSRHLRPIVLTPSNRDGGPVFEVSGSWKVLPGDDALQVVARDGIEPPTPAFSGPDSPKVIAFKT